MGNRFKAIISFFMWSALAAHVARKCTAHGRNSYKLAEETGHLEEIVGYKRAAQYRECKALYADIGRILTDPNYTRIGIKECPRALGLRTLCDTLPAHTPEQRDLRARVARYVLPHLCAQADESQSEVKTAQSPPAASHASLKAGRPPQNAQDGEQRDPPAYGQQASSTSGTADNPLHAYLQTQVRFKRALDDTVTAYGAYRQARDGPDAAALHDRLKQAWAACLELLKAVNTAFARLSQEILNESVEAKLLIIDSMLKPSIEATLKQAPNTHPAD